MPPSIVATYTIPNRHPFKLVIAKGSVVEFTYYPAKSSSSAIVDSRHNNNNFGGNDTSVKKAGGPNLIEDRKKLLKSDDNKRIKKKFWKRKDEVGCPPKGSAVITGPNEYGKLKVRYVIYANGGANNEMLSSAYSSILECAQSSNLEAIALPLVSTKQEANANALALGDLVKVALKLIRRYDGYSSLKVIYLCGYNDTEVDTLKRYAKGMFDGTTTFAMLAMGGSLPTTPKSFPIPTASKEINFDEKDTLEFCEGRKEESTAPWTDAAPNNETTSTFSPLGTYNTSGKYSFELITVQGNIANFSYPSNAQRSALVTSTTEDCMGGICTGVSGAVTISGGLTLLDNRHKLPTLSHSTNRNRPIRCPRGSAVITGPNNSYSGLKVPFVIHAVGGFDNETLESAYLSSLECAKRNNIEAIAFSLVSSDYHLGSRTIDEVVRVGVKTIFGYKGYKGLRVILTCTRI